MDSITNMDFLLEVVRCPRTGQRLRKEGTHWVTLDGAWAYRVETGIPILLAEEAEEIRL